MTTMLLDDVLKAYERAFLEREFDIAEKLLQILEELSQRNGSEEHLDQALYLIAASVSEPPKPH